METAYNEKHITKFDFEFELQLIDEIKKRPFLYRQVHAKNNSSKRKIAWSEIQDILGQSVEVCRRKWNSIRRIFRKHHRKAMEKCENAEWAHYETLKSFLEIQPYGTVENMNEEENSIKKCKPTSEENKNLSYKKCGEIMISKNKDFKFICWICQEEFNDIETFIFHALKIHLEIDISSNENYLPNYIEISSNESDNQSEHEHPFKMNDVEIKEETELGQKENLLKKEEDVTNLLKKEEETNLIKKEEDETETSYEQNEILSEKSDMISIDNNCSSESEFKLKINDTNESDMKKNQKLSDESTNSKPLKTRESKRGCFTCDQCNRIFEYRSQLYRHKRLHTGERPYKCEVCDQQFRHNRNLKDHFSICHNEDRPFPCRHEGCDKKFKTIRIRKLHEILHTNNLPFQCQECGKCFPSNSYLITHRNTWHVDKNNRRHKCNHCEKTFYSKQNLKFHIYTHTGERPYACPVCPTRFTKPWSVKEHMKIHFGERKYVCKVCDAAFNQIAGLIKHKKRHEEVVD